ncbi:MAG: Uma2 family endonuclease [Opitutales bacterium]|nr:Uma2 family endonuclease [Opitutales bacterium]
MAPAPVPTAEASIPALYNGDRLAACEFLRRLEAMPHLKKAELIDGIVFMGSPVSARHAEQDSLLQLLLGTYANSVDGVASATNATLRLGPDDVIQPDLLLRRLPDAGGQCRVEPTGYFAGPPELVAEIAVTSASIDLHAKRDSCRRAGVREYMVWDVSAKRIHWWALEEDEYRPLPEEAGIVESRVFPGLRVATAAMAKGDGKKALAVLRAGLG